MADLNVAVNETVSISERQIEGIGRRVYDRVFSISEMVKRTVSPLTKLVFETKTVSESTTRVRGIPKPISVSETLTIIENVSTKSGYFSVDLVSVAEFVSTGSGVVLSVNVSDAILTKEATPSLRNDKLVVRPFEVVSIQESPEFPSVNLDEDLEVSPYPIPPDMNLTDYWVVGL